MKTGCRILRPNDDDLQVAADLLRSGDIVSAPTETVYGLAANALDERACRKVFEIKGRPLIDPLIVHFTDIAAAAPFVELNQAAEQLAEAFWPGPLTLVLPKKAGIPDLVTAGLTSVAIRVPANPTFRRLLGLLDFPLAAPSANPFGYLSPTCAEHVVASLGERLTAVVDDGDCHFGVESTILDLRDPEAPAILRPGPIEAARIEEVLGCSLAARKPAVSVGDDTAQAAPGMLARHYSPNARIDLIPHRSVDPDHIGQAVRKAPLVLNTKPGGGVSNPHVYWLSENESLEACAHNLFALLHRLDQPGTELIRIEMVEESGIGAAVNDRLRRAAAKRS